MVQRTPLVSIIIPTKNSADTLDACLKSIAAQTYKQLEIIVVDNYSYDLTLGIAKRYNARAYLKGPERCAQLNFGVSETRGYYVYRVDSDFVLDPDVVSEAVCACETCGYDAIAVHNTSDPNVSFWAKVRKMERDSYRADEVHVGARFWKKEVFESVGGFDVEIIAGEDYDLQNRLVKRGFKIGRINAQETHIGEPKNLAEIFRKHFYYGQNIEHFIQKNRRQALAQLSPLRGNLGRGFSEYSGEPILIFGFFVYHFIRYAAASLGILMKKLKNISSYLSRISEGD